MQMCEPTEIYRPELIWNGIRGPLGANTYTTDHTIIVPGKATLHGAADEVGHKSLWHSPVDLLIASLLAGHMATYLHLCSMTGVVVTDYRDRAIVTVVNKILAQVILRPSGTITATSDEALAQQLHCKAHSQNTIAKVVTFSIELKPTIIREGGPGSVSY